jgi:hypothetical protein
VHLFDLLRNVQSILSRQRLIAIAELLQLLSGLCGCIKGGIRGKERK